MADLAAQLGPWQSSMLYVGPSGTLAPCHWDALDNIFTQLDGAKEVLLFAPDAAGLRAFPADHPYDSRSQVDLEAPTDEELRLMAGQGALASLQAGDSLFIPNHWWHHIHARQPSEGAQPTAYVSISINLWFNGFEELAVAELPWPPLPHIHPQIARAAETLLAAALPTRERAAGTMAELIALFEGDTLETPRAPPTAKTLHLHGVRNYVLHQLSQAYGREGAARFCRTFLDPARWKALRRICFRGSA